MKMIGAEFGEKEQKRERESKKSSWVGKTHPGWKDQRKHDITEEQESCNTDLSEYECAYR